MGAPDQRFTEACTRCKACLPACPNGILIQGRGGFPRSISPARMRVLRGLCPGLHTRRARSAGEYRPLGDQGQYRRFLPDPTRVVCRTCGEQCETGAIRFHIGARGVATPTLDAAQCTGCGACIAPCPSAAIRVCRAADEHPALQEAITA